MSKIILPFLFFSMASNRIYSQTDIVLAENLNTLGLSGKVKSVREISYNAKKGNSGITKTTKGWQYEFENDSECFFDTLGNLVLEHKILPSKKEVIYSIKYDSLNRISEVNRLLFTHRFIYDSLNRVVSSQKENRDAANSKSQVITDYLYYYDSLNLLVKKEEFGEESGVFIETFQYDSSRNLIYSELKSGDFVETHLYKYNENLLLIKEEWKNSKEGMIETTFYTYKDKVKLLERWVDYENGKPDGSIDDTYDKGNVIKSVEMDPDGEVDVLETCTYQYDLQGNWVKKTINCNEKYYIVERSIAYH